MQEYSVKDAVSFGWNKMKSNFGFFFILCVTVVLIKILLAVLNFILLVLKGMLVSAALPTIFSIIICDGISLISNSIISIIMSIGFIKIALALHDNEKAGITDLFKHYSIFFKALIGSTLYAFIGLVGVILILPGIIWENNYYVFIVLILYSVPGIIWAIRFSFYQYFIVDKDCGLVEAFKRSAAITDGFKWQLFQLGLLLAVINFAGMLCFILGLLATIPLSMMALAYTYRILLARVEGEKADITNPPVTNPA